MTKRRDFATAVLGICVAVILWLTLLSREILLGTQLVYHPFHAFESFWQDINRAGLMGNFIGNIILFIPIGLLFPIVSDNKEWYLTVLTGLIFSFIIEIIQFMTYRGCFDPDDILLNTIGTAIGFVLYINISRFYW